MGFKNALFARLIFNRFPYLSNFDVTLSVMTVKYSKRIVERLSQFYMIFVSASNISFPEPVSLTVDVGLLSSQRFFRFPKDTPKSLQASS